MEKTTEKTNAFVATFASKNEFNSFLRTNATAEGTAASSRQSLLFGTAHAVAHGVIPAEGAATAIWKVYALAVNKARAEKIALGTAVPLPIEGKEAKTQVSELHAAVRLASHKIGDTNAAIWFLMNFGSRTEYAAHEAVLSLKAVRKAAKLADDDNRLMEESDFAALFADKAPETDAECWKRLSDSIKTALAGNPDKGKKARRDVDGKAKQAMLLLAEVALTLAGKGVKATGKRKEDVLAAGTSGTSDLDQALAASAKADVIKAEHKATKDAKRAAAVASSGPDMEAAIRELAEAA
jgi:hypothetical protein